MDAQTTGAWPPAVLAALLLLLTGAMLLQLLSTHQKDMRQQDQLWWADSTLRCTGRGIFSICQSHPLSFHIKLGFASSDPLTSKDGLISPNLCLSFWSPAPYLPRACLELSSNQLAHQSTWPSSLDLSTATWQCLSVNRAEEPVPE